jgi:hypothetical protein
MIQQGAGAATGAPRFVESGEFARTTLPQMKNAEEAFLSVI